MPQGPPRHVPFVATASLAAVALVGCYTRNVLLAPRDAAADVPSPPADAAPADAGSVDAGSVDAGSVDAGSVDAGSVDAGSADVAPPRDDGASVDVDAASSHRGYERCTIFGDPLPAERPTVQRSCVGGPGVAGCGVVDVVGGEMVLGDDRIALGTRLSVNAVPLQPEVTVSDFRVDAMEVSVARFRRFVDAYAAGWERPLAVALPDCARSVRTASLPFVLPRLAGTAEAATYTRLPGAHESHPVNWVNWDAATLFCAYDGGRLPTEAEWEYLARYRPVAGLTAGRHFASGDAPPTGCRRSWSRGCAAIGRTALYTTPVDDTDDVVGGVYHLQGNVLEMTLDYRQNYRLRGPTSPQPTLCWEQVPQRDPLCQFVEPASDGHHELVFRGAGIQDDGALLYAASRNHIDGYNVTYFDVGFRCVYPPR